MRPAFPRLSAALRTAALAAFALGPLGALAAQRQPAPRPAAQDSVRGRGAGQAGQAGAANTEQSPDSAAGGGERQDRGPFAGVRLRPIGPAFISWRISDLAVHPRDKKVWYIAVASGGVWKTSDDGRTWTPLFDKQR